MEIGIICGDKNSNQVDWKTVLAIYLSLETNGTRYVSNRNPYLMMDINKTAELWRLLEEAIIRPRNITFHHYALRTTKQEEGVLIKLFFEKLKKMLENFELRSQEDIW